MKKLTATQMATRLGIPRSEVYHLLAEAGIIASSESYVLTEFGKQFGEEKYIDNDRYGRSYWLQVFNGEVVEMLRKIKVKK